jgi:formylglycine-generating enzyme required for sulfatase activity
MQVMRQDPSSQKGDNLPADSVSWEDVRLFCEKLLEL